MAPRSREEIISKQLSWLLRHGAVQEGLSINSEGFVPLDEVLQNRKIKLNKATLQEIKEIVATNAKKRFALRQTPDGKYEIRANQGHSLTIVKDIELTKLDHRYTGEAIHGTTKQNWRLIQDSGYLSRMSRVHIHFAPATPKDNQQVISGMRLTSAVYIYIDVPKAMSDGIEFFKSANEVILSPGDQNGHIPLKYFKKVVDRDGVPLM